MIAYKIVIFLILLLVLTLLSLIILQIITTRCPSKPNTNKINNHKVNNVKINNKKQNLYLDPPKYDIITKNTKPKYGELIWDDGKTLTPVVIPVYNSDDYYKNYYDDYYKGVINNKQNYDRENFENEAIQTNKLDEIIENNKNDLLLKLANQAYQDLQISNLENEISQLSNKL